MQTIEEFYRATSTVMPGQLNREIGHFNVFRLEELGPSKTRKMPYDRRSYYKISLISGRNKGEYADKVIETEKNTLLFATPKIPYHWVPLEEDQSGFFCIFSPEFLAPLRNGVPLEELPIFHPGGYPLFQLSDETYAEVTSVFQRMFREIATDYAYKYDLLRAFVLELIHYGQKLQPASALYPAHTAATRVSSLFVELLERQFPIESQMQRLQLRTAKEYADRLAVHVNHLNKVLKENLGRTTTDLIAGRVMQEAKILLKQTDWTVSEIAWSLGFEELAHFSNFFRKQAGLSPLAFRS